ncbi:MAG: ATP-dependent helicase HrpB, partial [Sphingobium sp.]
DFCGERGDIHLVRVAEIERTAERLSDLGDMVCIHRLHGSLDPAEQRAAIRPDTQGHRKIILATSIAETSLTIDGVHIVIDSGLARRPRYDRAAGVTRLVTEKASQAAATQRAGRAARQGPGIAYRLWEAAATSGLPPFDPPQILESDLSSLMLDCATWGVSNPATLRWIDPPPPAALAEARARLITLEALDKDGRITVHGRAIARLPLEPRIAHMLIRAAELGHSMIAAEIAVLLGERGLGGNEADLTQRLRRARQDRGPRAQASRALARRWVQMCGANADTAADEHTPGICLALAFPDRVAKRRSADGAEWISVGGRGFRLDPANPLAREEWLAVGEVQGNAAGARILSAAPLISSEITSLFPDRIEIRKSVRFRADTGGVEALRQTRLGAITLTSGGDDNPDPHMLIDALMGGVRQGGLNQLPWSDHARALRQRAGFAEVAELTDDALLADIALWLPPLLEAKRRLSEVDTSALTSVLDLRLGWEGRKRLDALTPDSFTTPAGSSHGIDYTAPGGPEVEVRVQALYGLAEHPCIGMARLPLRLSLTSPAGRPIQTTSDLPGFWAGSWGDVAKEMRGRYPRHSWPDDPASAAATLRTKRASAHNKC